MVAVPDELIALIKERFDADAQTLLDLKNRLEAVEKFVERSNYRGEEYSRIPTVPSATEVPTPAPPFSPHIVRFYGYPNNTDFDDGFRPRRIARQFDSFAQAAAFIRDIGSEYRVFDVPKLFQVSEMEIAPL